MKLTRAAATGVLRKLGYPVEDTTIGDAVAQGSGPERASKRGRPMYERRALLAWAEARWPKERAEVVTAVAPVDAADRFEEGVAMVDGGDAQPEMLRVELEEDERVEVDEGVWVEAVEVSLVEGRVQIDEVWSGEVGLALQGSGVTLPERVWRAIIAWVGERVK
jgi:hypothetical protein